MNEKCLVVDLDACVRCYACEIACRQENGLSLETQSRWCRVITIPAREVDGELHLDFVPVVCFQCDDPLCARFCPIGAISKERDGRVRIDEESCIGCRNCIYGCPWGAIYLNEVTKKAGKCDLCVSRTVHGLEPSCVQHCIGGSLRFIDAAELLELSQKRHSMRIGRVYYLSSKWKLNAPGSWVAKQ